jgi:hypothetical protein
MRIIPKFIKPGCEIILLGMLLTGCSTVSVASKTRTPTLTETAAAIATQTPTLTVTATLPPTSTPTVTATIAPPKPETAKIVVGKNYNYFPGTPDHDQATVEYVDLSPYQNKIFVVETETQGYKVRLGLYRGKIDLSKWWGDTAPLILETDFAVNASIKILVSPGAGDYSIVYITRPVQNQSPEYMEITRRLAVQEPKYPTDWSRPFVTEYWTFPDEILNQLTDPASFNENMNREYAALKDLLGKDSDLLDAEGHIHLIVEDIPYCGLAGNPIKMDPVCMGADMLNSGNPGWGAAHELGHDFVGPGSYYWEEGDGTEGWANFMAFYAYDNKIFINSEYDSAFWANVWETSPKPADIFQGLIVKMSHQYGWDIAKVFFRKYLAADPARDQDNDAKKKQAARYLAEAAREVTGKQEAYDAVVDSLAQKGFPQP